MNARQSSEDSPFEKWLEFSWLTTLRSSHATENPQKGKIVELFVAHLHKVFDQWGKR